MATYKIMPLGDSITKGQGEIPDSSLLEGYRGPLYTLLANGGYTFNFVGSLSFGNTLPDKDNAGYGGYAFDEIQALPLSTELTTHTPDIVLLLLGTNDIFDNVVPPTILSRLLTMLGTIHSNRPSAKTIVGMFPIITNTTQYALRRAYYKDSYRLAIAHRVAAGQAVTSVDFDSVALCDSVGHPSQVGYAQMAALWYAAIQAVAAP
jgi:lysophospholipase L1-like esterase